MLKISPLAACMLLAACGGGGGSVEMAPTRTEAVEKLESRIARKTVSDPSRLPVAGRADYEGYLRANLPVGRDGGRVDYIGDLAMDVNFAAARDEISGTVTGLQSGDGDRLRGALAVSGGDIFRDTVVRDNYTFTGRIDGTVRRGRSRYAIDAGLEGEFRGRDRAAVSGIVFGDVEGPRGVDIFDGSFVAERQEK